ncbi:hypothetical protein B1L04_05690 [Microcystis aeruginosa KW]|uniref:Uncharacterized protein n=1 Tax=Microcystis aeruginosa KW TaxID=1960155 RepID=A0A1V4BW30_MICAE|nr:hypothetical protein B1L04_05690 [Microcystis aeruginosa KW]
MSDAPLIKGGLKGGLRGDRHPPYQGGQGGSNLKSIFNLIITSYLIYELACCYAVPSTSHSQPKYHKITTQD